VCSGLHGILVSRVFSVALLGEMQVKADQKCQRQRRNQVHESVACGLKREADSWICQHVSSSVVKP
jgi:hypothetical protein